MLLRTSVVLAALVLSAGLSLAQQGQQPKPGAPTPQTAAQPATPPVKLPADLVKPRSQLQAEFAVASGDTVLFAYQGKDLTKRSVKILETQAAWLKEHADLPITLEAYCDDDLSREKTQQLCIDRGNSVKTELVRLGIAAERFKIVTFIDPPPKKGGGAAADGRKEEDKNRRNNRRVMTRIDA
jgi:outer membrane protein OmpA-like peptidoglycan-associated protein